MISCRTDSDDHQNGRHAEREREARILPEAVHFLAEDRRDERGDERAGVDGEVKHGEELLELLILLRTHELIAAECRHARLDAARAESDDEQTEKGECPSGRVAWKRKRHLKCKIQLVGRYLKLTFEEECRV